MAFSPTAGVGRGCATASTAGIISGSSAAWICRFPRVRQKRSAASLRLRRKAAPIRVIFSVGYRDPEAQSAGRLLSQWLRADSRPRCRPHSFRRSRLGPLRKRDAVAERQIGEGCSFHLRPKPDRRLVQRRTEAPTAGKIRCRTRRRSEVAVDGIAHGFLPWVIKFNAKPRPSLV